MLFSDSETNFSTKARLTALIYSNSQQQIQQFVPVFIKLYKVIIRFLSKFYRKRNAYLQEPTFFSKEREKFSQI